MISISLELEHKHHQHYLLINNHSAFINVVEDQNTI